MKNKTTYIIFLNLIAIFFSFSIAHAAPLNTETTVDVPASCTVTDTDNVTHNYPQTGSSDTYFTVCALDAALKNNSLSSVRLSNQYPSLGLFITAISDVVANPNSQYWAIYQNGSMANLGITLLPVRAGDTIIFQLNDFSDISSGNKVTIHINSLIPKPAFNFGGPQLESPVIVPISNNETVVSPPTKPIFDIKKASQFLNSQQKGNGSFEEDLYTDWVSIALASQNYQDQIIKLVKYFGESKMVDTHITDYERHAMALMSLGLNPYNTNGENYIEKITASFDGKQFGNVNQDNDDIFALIVLQNAGYTESDKIISDDISFILSQQKEDGSWDESVDMTGAGMESLALFNQNEQVKNALIKAGNYLKLNQKNTGGWNNVSSTAWAIEGILALSEKPEDWTVNNPTKDGASNSPLDYIAANQDTDGGIKEADQNNKIWETAYVVSALSGKTWNQIMQKFEKPIQKIQTPAIHKISIAKKIISEVKIPDQSTSTMTLPASTSTLSAFLKFFKTFLGKIL